MGFAGDGDRASGGRARQCKLGLFYEKIVEREFRLKIFLKFAIRKYKEIQI